MNTSTGVASFTGAGDYTHNTDASATATATPGYHLTKYTGTNVSGNTQDWTISGSPASDTDAWTMTRNRTVTAYAALNSYTLTFDANGGSVSPATKSVTFGSTATGLPTPTREGYDFNGWYLSLNSSVQNWFNLGRTMMYQDTFSVHLEAYSSNWTDAKSQRLISCTGAGGWNIEPNGTDSNYIAFIGYDSGVGYKRAISDVTWASLGSGWHSFDMTFDGNYIRGYIDDELVVTSDKFSSGKIAYNASNTLILGAEAGSSSTAPAGSFFNGKLRNVVINHNATKISKADAKNSFVVPAEDLTLTADWSLKTYSVSYAANGGTSTPATQTKTHGVTLTLAAAISHNSDSKTVTTTFDANGGTVAKTTISSTATRPYTFASWKATDGTSYSAGGSYTANTATIMTAQWTAGTYTGAAITLPTPTRTGYTFDGWYTASSGGTKKTSYSPASNSTLYAHWIAKTYDLLVYDGLTGETILGQSIDFDQTIELPSIPTGPVYSADYSTLAYFETADTGLVGDRTILCFTKNYPAGYLDDNIGDLLSTNYYTHTREGDAILRVVYDMPFFGISNLELQAPERIADTDYVLSYWQKVDGPSWLPNKITPGSVCDIAVEVSYDDLWAADAETITYVAVWEPKTLGYAWAKLDDCYKLCRLLYKANDQYNPVDCYYIKSDHWETVYEHCIDS